MNKAYKTFEGPQYFVAAHEKHLSEFEFVIYLALMQHCFPGLSAGVD